MGVYDTTGTRLTKAQVLSAAPAWTDPDPIRVVGSQFIRKIPYSGMEDPTKVEGRETQILANPGDHVRESVINSWFPAADITSLSPATGVQAGGTVVTATGVNLDGVTAVTVGGAAATALTYVDPDHIKFTTPAHSGAGAVNVVVTDDSGTDTETGAFTYT
jgi:hypothetical protein